MLTTINIQNEKDLRKFENSQSSMRTIIILLFCIIPFLSHAQNDVLVLQKRGAHVCSYTVGDEITFKTIYDQWFTGTIDALRHDSVYVMGQVFSYKEIGAIKRSGKGSGRISIGHTMMIAGAGFFAISAVNGLLRHDNSNVWLTTSGYIIGGALLLGGFILSRSFDREMDMGKKYRLLYLEIRPH